MTHQAAGVNETVRATVVAASAPASVAQVTRAAAVAKTVTYTQSDFRQPARS